MDKKTGKSGIENARGGVKASRRDFLATSGGVMMGAAFSAFSYERVLGANDRIRIGVIGCGGMGTGHIGHFVREDKAFAKMTNTEVTAVCDIYEPRKQRAGELSGGKVFHDHRDLLGSGLTDAVIIASPEHWHYRQTIDALHAGVHIYLQKPMTRSFEEAKSLYQEISKSKCVFQLGSQYMQTPAWRKARELYSQGKIGKMTMCQTSYCRNSKDGEWNYKIDDGVVPGKNLDWKAYLGPLTYVDYNPEYYFRWRKYRHFSGGIITDLLPHKIHTMSYVIGPRFPKRVTAVGGIYVQKDRDVADTVLVTVEFPDFVMMIAGSTCNEIGLEDMVRGNRGNLYVAGNAVRLVPERTFAEEFDAVEERVEPIRMNQHLTHVNEWVEAMRDSAKTTTWSIEPTYRVMTIIAMAEEAWLQGRAVEFDEKKQEII